MKKGVFAILKVLYNTHPQRIEECVCGTCFFVSKNEFITAYHCFNEDVFRPNVPYQHVRVFLVNDTKVIADPRIKIKYSDYDLSIGVVEEGVDAFFSNFFDSGNLMGKSVYNLGYPHVRAVKTFKADIVDGHLEIKDVKLSLEKEEGTVADIRIETYSSTQDQVKLSNKKLIILDHTSEQGFSGGPLILEGTEQVVGFMSLLPNKIKEPSLRVRAMPIHEIRHLL